MSTPPSRRIGFRSFPGKDLARKPVGGEPFDPFLLLRKYRSSRRRWKVRDPRRVLRTRLPLLPVVAGDEHVDGWDDEQGEEGADEHAADQHQADRIPRGGAGAGDQGQREMAADGGGAGHEDRAESGHRRLTHGRNLRQALELQLVGEFDDQDAVLGHQPDQGHQPDLRVDVEGGGPAVGPERDIRIGHLQEREEERAEHGQRHRTRQDDERVTEAVELGRQHQEYQDDGQSEGGQEPVPFGTQLAGLAGVVDDVPLGQDLRRFVLHEAQRLVEGPDGHAADLDRVQLLEAVERTGHDRFAQGGHGAQGDQPAVRTGNVDLLELAGVETVHPLDLRNDLVAAARDVEAVDEVAADQPAQVAADLLQAEPQGGHLVPVDDEFGLGLVDLDVDQRREGEHPALHRLHLQVLGEFQDLAGFGRRSHHEFDREIAAAGEGRRGDREDPDAGNLLQRLLDTGENLEDGSLAIIPWFGDHAPETGVGEGDLEGEVGFRHLVEDPVDLRGEEAVLVEGGVGGRVEDAEDDPLVLHRSQLLGGHDEHRHGDEGYRDPDRVDRRTRRQGGIETAAVGVFQALEIAGDAAGQAALPGAGLEQPGRHERRQGQGHDPGDGDRSRQSEGELPEERAGQPPLQTDGEVDRRQGDGHGDDRTDQFAGAGEGRFYGRFSFAQVAFHVLHHHDGVVDHQPDRENDGQQGEQVHGEPEGLHQEDAADQRHRDRHHRDEDRTEGAQEQEDDDHDDHQRVAEGLEHLPDGARDVLRGVIGDAGLEADGKVTPDRFHLGPYRLDDVEGVRVGERPDPHEH